MPAWTWTYFILMAAAIAAGAFVSRFTQKPLPISRGEKLGLMLGAFCGAMLFAKLPYLFLDWNRFLSGRAWFDNGKTITLGIMGGYFGVEVAKWALRIPFKTGDGFAVPAAVAIGIGRLSCFSAGCCFGTPTDLPWGVRFHDAALRHPTQIYEMIFHFTMAAGMWHLQQQRVFTGNLIKFYFVSYYVYRFVTEFIRPEPRILLGLTFYQWASLVGIALFATLWLLDARKFADLRRHETNAAEALSNQSSL